MDFLASHYAHLASRDIQNRGYISEDLNIVLISLSFFLYGLRMYSRLLVTKSPGLDDVIITVGLIFATTLSILEIKCVEYGAGRQLAEVAADNPAGLSKFFQTLPTMQLLYFAGTGIVRLGITAFLLRLTSGLVRAKTFTRIIYAVGGLIAALTIGAFFGLLFECWPVKNLWNKGQEAATCYSSDREADLMYTHAALGIFFDTCLFIIPIWILKSSALHLKPRLIIVFSIALVAVACGLIRLLVIVRVNMAVNTTYNIISASVWTDLEIHVGIWVSCFPALQPLLRICYRRLGIKSTISNTKPTTGSYNRYGQKTLQGTRAQESATWIMLEDSSGVQSRVESNGQAKNNNQNRGIAVSTRVDISS